MPTNIPHSPKRSDSTRGRLTGRKVFLMFCGFFGIIFTMNGIMMFFAFSTFGGLDASGAYRGNFLLTKDLRAAARQTALGWDVNGSVKLVGNKKATINIVAKDRDGNLINIKSLNVELRRPIDKRQDGTIVMRRTGQGRYSGVATAMKAGQYDFMVTLYNRNGLMHPGEVNATSCKGCSLSNR